MTAGHGNSSWSSNSTAKNSQPSSYVRFDKGRQAQVLIVAGSRAKSGYQSARSRKSLRA